MNIFSFPALLLILLSFCTSGVAQTRDTIKRENRRSLFADTQELTSSDYLAAIERANELMNSVRDQGEFRGKTMRIFTEISGTNQAISLISQNINETGNTNVRNQRMYENVLHRLEKALDRYETGLQEESEKIIALKKELRTVIKDTVFRSLVRDSILRKQFQDQLTPLRAKFFSTDSVLKYNLRILNVHKAQNTSQKMVISEALVNVGARLDRSGISMFKSEYPNIWDTEIKIRDQGIGNFIARKYPVEFSAFKYYFEYSIAGTMLLILIVALLYWWIRHNLKRVAKSNELKTLDAMGFRALNRGILIPVFIIGLNLAIVFNLYAPALFIEVAHLLLLVCLSILFIGRWHPKTFRRWILLVIVFLAFSFIDLFLNVTLFQRCLFILVNIMAIRFGFYHLKFIREEIYVRALFSWANYLFIGFNILAIIFNLFGRVSLAYTLSLTAIIGLTQMIALSVLLRIIIEIIVLQVYGTRLRRGTTKLFDHEKLEKNAQRPFLLLIIYMWIVVLASNLNLSDALTLLSDNILTRENKIGSFSFTIGGILLFFLIVWIAHLLQQFVSFFFGGIDEDDTENVNKRQHSRLLITRLFLLIAGYLLAIAASGMPIDKITIILGALGVGVGLGLQSIVANFVSGVILIFERPIQIGDVIESGGHSGRVKEIGLRTTRMDTTSGSEVIIPNANILNQNIVNWTATDNYKLTEVNFTVTGTITRQQVLEVIVAALNTVIELDSETEPQVFFDSISDSKTKVKVKFWCNIYRTEQAVSEVRLALYDSFKKRDICLDDCQ